MEIIPLWIPIVHSCFSSALHLSSIVTLGEDTLKWYEAH